MEIERNLGIQPLAALLEELGLRPHDLVLASSEQLTHKLAARALRGRRLTDKSKAKVARALNAATGRTFEPSQLFNY